MLVREWGFENLFKIMWPSPIDVQGLYFEVVTMKEAALEADHQTKLEIKLETNLKREVLIHLVM